MNFSAQSLLQLQRLARVVKKELQMSVSIARKEGISELLRYAASENYNVPVFAAYNEFIASLTEQDRKELATYKVSIMADPVNHDSGSSISKNDKSDTPDQTDRRQVNFPVERDRRKKEQYYRGVLATNDRRKQHEVYHGKDKRIQAWRNDNKASTDIHQSHDQSELEGQHADRGMAVDEESGQPKPRSETIKKSNRMYRGQPVFDDD
jgi:hypothetical protein